jgi:integrase
VLVRWQYMTRSPAVDAGRNPQPTSAELRPFARDEIDTLAVELGPVYGPLVVSPPRPGCARTSGLRSSAATSTGQPVSSRCNAATRTVLTPYPKTKRSRRRVPLTARAVAAIDALPAQLRSPLVFPAPRGGYLRLDNWRHRDWYPALDAAGLERRGPYGLRHTFATEALHAGVSVFELARVMGTSVEMIDRTYGHLASDSEASIRARLERSGVEMASEAD